MKTKPKLHKARNTFKFQTFSERISNVDIDVFHKVKHPYEEDDDVQTTYYSQCLKKWISENFSPNFVELSKQLPRNISLPQLLARKNEVMDIIIVYLKKSDGESLQPILELLVAIAKDLRKEFYEFFNPCILRECVRLLDTREPDEIELIFTCLAHLFKYLWSPIIKDINNVLPELLPLLSNSKPHYINNFAAESFAFVARKVRDKLQFLHLCLKNIKNNREELVGVARLFFEVIKTVGNYFHSGAEEFLYIIFKELGNSKWSHVLFPVCDHLIFDIISFISSKTDVSPVWNAIMHVCKEFYAVWSRQCDIQNAGKLLMILKLNERFITCREIILRNPSDLLDFMLTLAIRPNIRDFPELHCMIIDIISLLLTNSRFSLNVMQCEDVITRVFNNIHEELIVRFSERIIAEPKYEFLILNHVLKFINGVGLSDNLIQFLVKVVWMRTSFQFDKASENNLNTYVQCLRSVPETFIKTLVTKMHTEIQPETVEIILHAVIVLCHIDTSRSEVTNEIDKILDKLQGIISNTDRIEGTAKLLFIMLITMQFRVQRIPAPSNCNGLITLATKFIDSSNYLCSLRILDSLSQYSAFSCLNTSEGKQKLINNLSSPFHKVRFFSLHILVKMKIHPIFELLHLVESTEVSIETYRDKLHKLQKLECTETFRNEVEDVLIKSAVLKFLFGNLYINFQYIWEPTQKLILTHLDNDDSLWSVYECQLKDSVANDINNAKLMENLVVDFKCDFFQKHFYDVNGVDDRPDFYNFRCLLFSILSSFKSYKFSNNDCVLDMFLKFYSTEYMGGLLKYSSSCNVKKQNNDFEGDEIENEKEFNSTNDDTRGRNLNKLLIILLKFISNTSHLIPQKRQEEVFDIHYNLLSNGNSEIQQLAIDYICKIKKMIVHKDRLLCLTKENSFKAELLNIRIDFNSDTIPVRDTDFLMKIILKITYGKIRKKGSVHLRNAIFEFLGGCNDKYIMSFFEMFFKEVNQFIKDHQTPSTYFFNEIDLENTLSPSCLLSYVSTALDLLKKCGKLLNHSCSSYLLKVMFKVAAHMVILVQTKTEIHPRFHGVLSKIRVRSFETIIYLFENFEYKWNSHEMEAVFQCFVEPWMHKISEECLQSPNPVFKLFLVFTKNTRYFPLLAHKHGDLTPLDTIMRLLNSKKVSFNIKNSILELIEKLLTLEEESEDNEVSDLMYLDNSSHNVLKGKQQYGTQLLLPYVSEILEYLEMSLNKKYVKLNSIYMLILKRVSQYDLDEEISATLLNLLVPVLKSRTTCDDDVLLPLLDTIFNLFKTFKTYDLFERYLLQIAPLFSVVTSVTIRKALCDIVNYFSQKTGNKFITASFVKGMNSFDRKWLDQPDYVGRLEAFKNVNVAAENHELNLYTGVFVIYNCYYTIKTEKDMALRDHAALCLKKICPLLVKKYSTCSNEINTLLNTTLLPLIKEGIQSKNENHQSESVMLLGHMVRECCMSHSVFKDLYVLSDSSDLEVDFFENVLHLQHHRRTKVWKRFNEVMSLQMKSPQPYSLMFVFPLISDCLLCDKTANMHGLINAAIEALKVICRLSSWNHYERIFKQYVAEMRKNVSLRKQGIRIVSAILDSFHFDITKAVGLEKPAFRKVISPKKNTQTQNTTVEPMEVAEPVSETVAEPAVKRIKVLCRSDAVRVYKSIKSFLVPSLDRIFMTYEDSEQFHKLSKKGSNNEKEELAVLSIPIAFAAVKLLKQLSRTLLDEYISTVFLKLSTYLKSRLLSIRLVARETMQNILLELGPIYFPKLLSEMRSILTKGFQIHVLVFTCHAILEKIKSLFKENQMDACMDHVLEICIVDLFGKLAEEKEVVKISSKTPEAKGNKSYNMLSILAEYISEKCILNMVIPLKEILFSNMSSKVVTKVRRCLQYIALGLTRNQFLKAESLLELAYGISNDCIPSLLADMENIVVRIEEPVERADCLLIPQEPRHLTAKKYKVCSRSNAHIIIEFGVELLQSMLKREIIKSPSYRPHLDPFVPVLKDSLQSRYNKLIILSLKCLIYLLKRDLPSLKENVPYICNSVFSILGKYSSAAVSGENAELLMSATKVALVLIRDLKHNIDNNQLRILLFVAEDLQKNISHYGTGFSLIRAIVGRQFSIREVHELMKRTAELSISSYNNTIRLMARKAYYQYLMNYPHGKKLQEHVMFFVSQLKYEEVAGRKSALEMLTVLVNVFPLDVVQNLCSVLYVQLAFRLIQDNSSECKEMVSNCISRIISRIQDTKQESELLDVPLIWMNERKVLNRRLAVQLLGIFVSAKKEKFGSKLSDVLPLIENQFCTNQFEGPGKFVRAPTLNDLTDSNVEFDELVFQVLQLYKTIMEVCPHFLNSSMYTENVQLVADSCQYLLRHSHEWVRLSATQILGLVFKSMDASTVANVISKKCEVKKPGFLLDERGRKQFKSLCLDFSDQLAPGHDIMEQLLKQSMKNLLFMAEVLSHVNNVNKKELSLPWLVNRLVKQMYLEVAYAPQKYTVRTMVFNWLAALAVKFDSDKLLPLLSLVLLPVVRELSTTDEQGVEIRRIAKEVGKYYRENTSGEEYDKTVCNLKRLLEVRKAKRRDKLTQMALLKPEVTALRKQKIQLKKKEQKKRKLEKLRKRKFKSGKRKFIEIPTS